MTKASLSAFVVALGAAAAATALATGGDDRALKTPQLLGPTAPGTEIDIVVGLRGRDAALDRYARAVGDPRSRLFRRYLTPAELGRRFGPPLPAMRRVVVRLRRAGIDVTDTLPERSALYARGTAAVLSREFGVTLANFVDPAGNPYHAPLESPTIPRPMRQWVSGVFGLDTRARLRPADVRDTEFTPNDAALAPSDAMLAYHIRPLRARGLTGRGLTIAIASYSSFALADADRFAADLRLKGPRPRIKRVAKGVQPIGIGEANLDVDVIRGIVPGAQVIVYEAPNTGAGELKMYDALLAGPATIVSDSWGFCDSTRGLRASEVRDYLTFRNTLEKGLKRLAAAGITVYVASGDAGAFDCQSNDFGDHDLTVDFPSNSASVVAVGGTLLDVREDGTYFREAGWEDSLSNGGGGGGVSPFAAKPRWQKVHRVGGAGRHRVLPDVAAAAAPGSPWWVRSRDTLKGKPYYDWSWGTSAAAPFWAASMLLVQEWAQRHGAGSVCFAAPVLYGVAFTQPGSGAFHDVTRGGNRHYDAAPGWDHSTGLGSPDVWNLSRAVARYLRLHPGSCKGAAAGAGSGQVARLASFRLPSGNIGCEYLSPPSTAALRCDILSGLRPRPSGTCAAPVRWAGLALFRGGGAEPNCALGRAFTAGSPILAYGRTWRRGAFTCTSSTDGLRCGSGGHGFFLARERWRAF